MSKMLRNISTFRFQLPAFLSYHLRNARNGRLRTTYIIPPSPPPLPKELAPSASFGPSHRWIASLCHKKSWLRAWLLCVVSDGLWTQYCMSRQLQSKLKSLSQCLITHISYYKLPIGADDNDSNRFSHFISLSQQTSTTIA